jgi:hypothetical protein
LPLKDNKKLPLYQICSSINYIHFLKVQNCLDDLFGEKEWHKSFIGTAVDGQMLRLGYNRFLDVDRPLSLKCESCLLLGRLSPGLGRKSMFPVVVRPVRSIPFISCKEKGFGGTALYLN